jgi:predicted RNA binding protein YcfA (HicA-like mRNA interferase family)
MSQWPATRTSRVYRALVRIGWSPVRERAGSHVQLRHPDFPHDYTWAFHDSVEIGPAMLARIAKKTGLKPEDL